MALQAFTVPVSVKKLGSAVFASSVITELHYEGTVSEWNAVVKNERWHAVTDLKQIVCSDGTVVLESASE
jgi:hypothetical protein